MPELALLGTVYEQHTLPGGGNHSLGTGVRKGVAMRYCIERLDGQHCLFVDGRKELLIYLKQASSETITDIHKVYRNGVSDSVLEIYLPYRKQ